MIRRKYMSEVAQPKSEDEQNFKEKHIVQTIDYPIDVEDQFTDKKRKRATRIADYTDGDDKHVYEGITLKRDLPGQEDADVDNDGDSDYRDKQYHLNRKMQIRSKVVDESVEQIDEISKETLKSYMTKASDNAQKLSKDISKARENEYKAELQDNPKKALSIFKRARIKAKKLDDRYDGLKRARDVLYPDEIQAIKRSNNNEKIKNRIAAYNKTEQIDEVSKETLKSYLKKLPGDATRTKFQAIAHTKRAVDTGGDTRDLHFDMADKLHRRYNNRINGNSLAVDKLTRESLDKVGREDSDINNDGREDKIDRYLAARRRAIAKRMRSEEIVPVEPAGGHFGDKEHSHVKYKKSNMTKKLEESPSGKHYAIGMYVAKEKENDEPPLKKKTISLAHDIAKKISVNESFSAGPLKLNDGKTVTVSKQDAELLNKMFNDLNSSNKKKMEAVLLTDKSGYDEIVSFAREAL